LLLACAALTDGDLEAAVALYEPDAALSWGPDRTAAGHVAIRRVLARGMDMRLPLRARSRRRVRGGPLALLTGGRTPTGPGLGGVAGGGPGARTAGGPRPRGPGVEGAPVPRPAPRPLGAGCHPDGAGRTAADRGLPGPGREGNRRTG